MPTEHDEKPVDPAAAVRDRPAQPAAADPRTTSPRPAECRIGPAAVTPARGAGAAADTPAPADGPRSRGGAARPEVPPAQPETDSGTVPPTGAESTRIVFTEDGPALVDGPVELVTADGAVIHADRFLVAICLCKRSRTYPLCDTSHRRHRRCDR